MWSRLLTPDLVAGVAASALFLALVLLTSIGPGFGLVLAILAYLGLRLVLPRPSAGDTVSLPAAEAIRRCQQRIAEIERLGQRLRGAKRAAARQRVLRIGELAGRILAAIRDDPKKQRAAEPYLIGYLAPIQSLLSRYVLLAERDLDSAAEALSRAERETLPKIEEGLERLYEKLHSEDLVDLEVESEMLELRFAARLDEPG